MSSSVWRRSSTPRSAHDAPNLGKQNRASNEKAQRVLGWKPRAVEESVVDTARSLIDLGLIKS